MRWSDDAVAIDRMVRAFNPAPGAFASLDGAMIKVWAAEPAAGSFGAAGTIVQVDANGLLVACGRGALLVRELQRAGGRRQSAASFAAGHRIAAGAVFDAVPVELRRGRDHLDNLAACEAETTIMLANWFKTALLMAAIMALFGVVGAAIGGGQGMLIALLFGGGMNLLAYWFSDAMVLSSTMPGRSMRRAHRNSTGWCASSPPAPACRCPGFT